MKNAALKLSLVLASLSIGGCASSNILPGAGVVKYERHSLRNPTTGQIMSCGIRITASTPLNAKGVYEANLRACIRNARAGGFTHEVQVTKWP